MSIGNRSARPSTPIDRTAAGIVAATCSAIGFAVLVGALAIVLLGMCSTKGTNFASLGLGLIAVVYLGTVPLGIVVGIAASYLDPLRTTKVSAAFLIFALVTAVASLAITGVMPRPCIPL